VIVDFRRFLVAEEPYWSELEAVLDRLETHVEHSLTLEEAQRFHYLYQRASADLARLAGQSMEPRIREHLEPLVARAYAEIHETRGKPHRFSPVTWFLRTFPQTFRRRGRAFAWALAITIAGILFGAGALYGDRDSKRVLMPFPQLMVDPAERVQHEESQADNRLEGHRASFSTFLMTHNVRVAIMAMALGMAWGAGTVLMLFYNGVMVGAVFCDYVMAGQIRFVAGWLLPHGAVEIPAILIAGQAGLVLGGALIGRGASVSVRARLRAVSGDVATLIAGVAVLLVWAGFVEAFFSQYHEPIVPYALKIAVGLAELGLLSLFLARSGREIAAEGGRGSGRANRS
jgi:uncharacterized membrane protein SpoIIM required for sporulation